MKKRVLSAAILIAIFVPLIIIGGIPFKIGVGIVSILAFKEVIDLKKKLFTRENDDFLLS